MKFSSSLLILTAILFTGCVRARDKARDVAVTTFRVIDAPARYVRNRIDPPATTTTTTTEVATSDVVTPGRPVTAPPPQRTTTVTGTAPAPAASPRATARPQTATTTATPRPSPPASTTGGSTDFPVAKAVPDKPGFVLSPYDGAYVDVTGFKSGDKARDPKTKQIFIVP